MVKKGLRYFGLLLVVIGAIWFLQGIGILHGSPMTGERFWLWTGLVTSMVGLVLFLLSRRLVH